MANTRAGGFHRFYSTVRTRGFYPLGLFLLGFALLPLEGSAQIRPIELEGFVVSGTPVPRTEGTVASFVTVLDGDELRLRGVTRVLDALAEVPGLVVVQGGSYGSIGSLFLRGGESDHMKVLVDGVEMNQAGGAFDFSGLLLSDVGRIEVVRGPASAFYGSDAMAGVIHVITRRGRGPLKASVSTAGGTFGRMNWGAEIQGGTDTSGYALSLSRESTDGILEFNNEFENTAASGKVFASPDQRTRLELAGRYSDRTFHFPTDNAGNVVDQNAFTFGEEWGIHAEAGRMVSDRVEILASLRTYHWDGGTDDRSDGPADTLGYYGFAGQDAFQRNAGDFRMNLTPWSGSVLSFGFELEQEQQDSRSESFSQWGPSEGEDSYERWNRGYYAHFGSEGAGLAWNIGIRQDDNEQYGGFFTYQAGLSYTVSSERMVFRANMGKGLKEPTFLETSSTGFSVGNPDLEPERSLVWEVGVNKRLGESGSTASVTWFHQSLKDLIQYTFSVPNPGDPNFFNVAEAQARGIEAVVSAPVGALTLSGSYTYLDTQVLDSGFDEGEGAVFVEGERLIRRPQHQGAVAIAYRLPRGTLSGGLRWTGARSDRDFSAWPASVVELPAYSLLGMGLDLNLLRPNGGRPGLDLTFRGENLLDETYEGVFGFRGPGRAFLVGARMEFGR
jgi:vitamin B12 transporter